MRSPLHILSWTKLLRQGSLSFPFRSLVSSFPLATQLQFLSYGHFKLVLLPHSFSSTHTQTHDLLEIMVARAKLHIDHYHALHGLLNSGLSTSCLCFRSASDSTGAGKRADRVQDDPTSTRSDQRQQDNIELLLLRRPSSSFFRSSILSV